MPNSFAETDDGTLLIADGFGPMLAWDGFSPQARLAGVPKPTQLTGPVLTGSGFGAIIGTYVAFVRFLDALRRPSDLSVGSAETELQGNTGQITQVTNTSPLVVTTALPHGMSSGNRVTISGVLGQLGANGVWDVEVVDPTNIRLLLSVASGTYTTGGVWEAGVDTILYTNLPTTSDPRVVYVQILRNTDGQAGTFYVDVEYDNPQQTTASSTRIDADLNTQEAVVLSDADGNDLANLYAEPPDSKSYLIHHKGRMYAGGEVEYTEGAIALTNGSAVVRGIGTEWTSAVRRRFLYVVNGDQKYEVLSIDVPTQTLTLTTNYGGATAPYAPYALRPPPAEERLVQFSEAGFPEAFPPGNSFSLPDDGDMMTGLMSKNSWVWVLERNHIYRFTCDKDPLRDGECFLDTARGCVNNNCWVPTADATYMLDDQGVHKFDPVDAPGSQVMSAIATFLRPGNDGPKVNWAASRYFHAFYDQASETIRYFVSLSGQYLPRHCITYQYLLDRWWVEEYATPISSSCVGRLARIASANTWGSGRPQVFLGSVHRRVLAFNMNRLDGPDQNSGTVSDRVVSASVLTITAATDKVFAADCVGNPVVITAGRGAGQRGIITSVSGNVLRLKTPLLVVPDATSTFMVGGIEFVYRTGWFRWADSEQSTERRIELQFKPTTADQYITMRRYRDRLDVATPAPASREDDGIKMRKDSPDLLVNLKRPSGFVQSRIEGSKEVFTDGPRLISVELAGTSGKEPVEVYQITIDGAGK